MTSVEPSPPRLAKDWRSSLQHWSSTWAVRPRCPETTDSIASADGPGRAVKSGSAGLGGTIRSFCGLYSSGYCRLTLTLHDE
jgi:hypothetical protein